MKHRNLIVLFTLALVLATASAEALEVKLNGVTCPEGRQFDLAFEPTDAAPDAELRAKIRFESGQADIDMEYKKLEPAVLFAGDITTYVLWAVPPVAAPVNLGTFGSVENKGNLKCSTTLKTFALIVTAEPLLTVPGPSKLLVFTSKATTSKHAANAVFDFNGFVEREQIAVGNPSILGMKYEGSSPPILIQAQKSMELVERFGAAEFAPDAIAKAKTALAQATNSFRKGGSEKAGVDYAQRTIELTSQALTNWMKDVEARAEAARLAREQEIKADLGHSEATRRQLEIDMKQLEADQAQLKNEKAQLKDEKAQIKKERDALAGRLSGALAAVSNTARTARGYVVSFGDINFATGKADLADNARLNLAKLAGILLMMPETNVRVEGHTDATGTAEINAKLSTDRANAVGDLLISMGVDTNRIIAEGYGSSRPIQPNDTSEGRAQNRRVELVLNEGTIALPSD